MQINENRRASFASRRQQQMSRDDALRLAFISIAEPCGREPRVFADTKYGARQPWAMVLRYMRQAFDAARSQEARKDVVERCVVFFNACIADVRTWLNEMPSARRDIFEPAQQADGEEDVAELLFLMEPTPANAARLIEAGRRDRARSETRELYLVKIAQQGRDNPTRPAA